MANFICFIIFLILVSQNYNLTCANQMTTEEAMRYLYYANLEKEKYDSPSSLSTHHYNNSNIPTVYYPYNLTEVGTQLLLVFANQADGSLAAKSDPTWSDSWTNRSECGASTVSGEIRACVDSKQSMLNFVAPIMGAQIRPMYTPRGKFQLYRVVGAPRTISHRATPCHHKDLGLPFAVYNCHFVPNSLVRLVPLLGADGTRLEALTVCHMNTSSWNPNGFILQLLNIKPGPSVCHFLATDDLVWVHS
ncbi:hypothetical protein OROHE_009929 [Orobanche hederae]